MWVSHLREGMHYCGTEIYHKYEWAYPSQRKNNVHIMDVLLDSREVPFQYMEDLNYVLCFVEGTTLAEITTSGGKRIRKELFHPDCFVTKGEMNHQYNPNTWPRHGNPDKPMLRKWKAALMAT
eukprot:2040794-Ditylum_brightwellii.AAC.1